MSFTGGQSQNKQLALVALSILCKKMCSKLIGVSSSTSLKKTF